MLNYSVDTAAKDEIERIMGINPDYLRFLTLVTEDLPTEPSAIMKERAYAEARAERGGYGSSHGASHGGASHGSSYGNKSDGNKCDSANA